MPSKIPEEFSLDVVKRNPQVHKRFIDAARNGDVSTLPVLRKLVDLPSVGGTYYLQPLSVEISDALIDKSTSQDLVAKESVRHQLSELKSELARDGSSALEMLLIDRIAICWLELSYYEMIYFQNMGDLSNSDASFYLQRINAAEKRHIAAIKSLAQVRRLRIPLLMLNIADKQQVNVMTRGGDTTSGDLRQKDPTVRLLPSNEQESDEG